MAAPWRLRCHASHRVVHCTWHKTRDLPPLYDDLRTLGNARPASPMVRGVVCHLCSMPPGKGNTDRFTMTTAAACSGEPNPRRSHATRGDRSEKILCMCLYQNDSPYQNEKLTLNFPLILIHMGVLLVVRPSHRRVCGQEAEGGPLPSSCQGHFWADAWGLAPLGQRRQEVLHRGTVRG